ncbi:hypothetical protein ACQY0O_000127 [Thecaphora frezii]
MSARDTDLIEITLDTIYSLDKLQKTLAGRKATLDLARQRLTWERRLCECWKEYCVLERELRTFVEKRARWSSSEYSRRAQASGSSTLVDDAPAAPQEGHVPAASIDEQTRLGFMASWQITGEAIELEAVRLNLRIKALGQESVSQTGILLDIIIDQCQVPEKFIDEQEKLEEAMPGLLSQGVFVTSLADQWERADKAYRGLKALRRQARSAESMAVEGLQEKPDRSTRDSIHGQITQLLDGLDGLISYDRQQLTTVKIPGASIAWKPHVRPPEPIHPAFEDQQHHNVELQKLLQKDASSTLKRAWLASLAAERYSASLELFEATKSSFDQLHMATQHLSEAEDRAIRQHRAIIGAFALDIAMDRSDTSQNKTSTLSSESDKLRQCLERLEESTEEAMSKRDVALHHLARSEAAGMADARKWLDADVAIGHHASCSQSADGVRRQLLDLIEALSAIASLQSAIARVEQETQQLASELEGAYAKLIKDVATSMARTTASQVSGTLELLHAASRLESSTKHVRDLVCSAANLQDCLRGIGIASDPTAGAINGLNRKVPLLAEFFRSCQYLTTQFHIVQRANSEHARLRAQLDRVSEDLDRNNAGLQDDWEGQLSKVKAEASAASACLQDLQSEIGLFDRACTNGIRMDGPLPTDALGDTDLAVKSHINGLWVQLKTEHEAQERRASELARMVEILESLEKIHAEFDERKEALITYLDGTPDDSHDEPVQALRRTSPLGGASSGSTAFSALQSLDESGESLRRLWLAIEFEVADVPRARASTDARLSELERLQTRFYYGMARRKQASSMHPAPTASTPRRLQQSQQRLGLGFGPSHQRLKSNGLRTEAHGNDLLPSKDDFASFATLLARSREGPIALQTIDDQGRLQMQQLLDLPGDEDGLIGEHFWKQLHAELESLGQRPSVSSDEKLRAKIRLLDRDIGVKSQRFRDLCVFSSVAAKIDRHQSQLLELADTVTGSPSPPTAPSPFDLDTSRDSMRDPSRAGTPSNGLRERLQGGIEELGALLNRAKKASLRVRSDLRVRRRLAKLVRSTVEVSDTARAALDPNAEFDPDQSDDGLSVCTFSSFDHLDRFLGASSAAGAFPRVTRSGSVERSLPGMESPYTPSAKRRNGINSRASVRSPMSSHPKSASGPSELPGPLSPSRIPRTPRQVRDSSLPPRSQADRASSVASVTQPNRYRADPKNRLDVAVGRIVNQLPMTVKVSPATTSNTPSARPGYQDESGQYWVGDPEPKLCFCRILRSKTVMVRIGGGWQELSQFILQHYSHLAGLTVTPTSSPNLSRKTPSTHSPSPWLRSASGTLHPSALRQQQSRHHVTPSFSASPLSCPRLRVESMPDATVMTSPLEAYRLPSSIRTAAGTHERTPSKVGYGKRHASSSGTPSNATAVPLGGAGDTSIDAILEAKLSLY